LIHPIAEFHPAAFPVASVLNLTVSLPPGLFTVACTAELAGVKGLACEYFINTGELVLGPS